MPDREKVIKGLEMCIKDIECTGCPYENDCFAPDDNPFGTSMMRDALALLKEQELPTELKQKMWNALYAVEDEYEKQFVGTDEHGAWFTTFRPWLQKGFDIAIKTIADWEGR